MTKATSLKKNLTLKQAKIGYERYMDSHAQRPRPSFDWWWYLEEVDVSVDNYLQFEEWVALRQMNELKNEDVQQKELHSVSAIQLDNLRVEYSNPDFAFAYTSLIPDVAAAAAYLDCGEVEKAKKALTFATQSIELFRQYNGVFAIAETPRPVE